MLQIPVSAKLKGKLEWATAGGRKFGKKGAGYFGTLQFREWLLAGRNYRKGHEKTLFP